ncbi:hypothetical protein [Streptomyces sp. NPDC050388]|uniref:hypothetical protein n=1 Tax=Streptomyces sp. NPDC050388 TaxID=3155781 RepID=UPI00342477C0
MKCRVELAIAAPGQAVACAGWTVALAETDRAACVAYIEENWTDMRPKSLIEAMAGSDS